MKKNTVKKTHLRKDEGIFGPKQRLNLRGINDYDYAYCCCCCYYYYCCCCYYYYLTVLLGRLYAFNIFV